MDFWTNLASLLLKCSVITLVMTRIQPFLRIFGEALFPKRFSSYEGSVMVASIWPVFLAKKPNNPPQIGVFFATIAENPIMHILVYWWKFYHASTITWFSQTILSSSWTCFPLAMLSRMRKRSCGPPPSKPSLGLFGMKETIASSKIKRCNAF